MTCAHFGRPVTGVGAKGINMLSFGLLGIGAIATAGAPAHPPLLPDTGLFECWVPDPKAKTCRVIASYRMTGLGTYKSSVILALRKEGPVTVETHSDVYVRGDAACSIGRAEDDLAGTVRVGSEIIPSELARPILEGVAQAMAPAEGQETCVRYVPSGSGFIAKATIDGMYHPDQDTVVTWIKSSDGYSLRP